MTMVYYEVVYSVGVVMSSAFYFSIFNEINFTKVVEFRHVFFKEFLWVIAEVFGFIHLGEFKLVELEVLVGGFIVDKYVHNCRLSK